jgi:hypothetical protein
MSKLCAPGPKGGCSARPFAIRERRAEASSSWTAIGCFDRFPHAKPDFDFNFMFGTIHNDQEPNFMDAIPQRNEVEHSQEPEIQSDHDPDDAIFAPRDSTTVISTSGDTDTETLESDYDFNNVIILDPDVVANVPPHVRNRGHRLG